jgi:hypothetical protein
MTRPNRTCSGSGRCRARLPHALHGLTVPIRRRGTAHQRRDHAVAIVPGEGRCRRASRARQIAVGVVGIGCRRAPAEERSWRVRVGVVRFGVGVSLRINMAHPAIVPPRKTWPAYPWGLSVGRGATAKLRSFQALPGMSLNALAGKLHSLSNLTCGFYSCLMGLAIFRRSRMNVFASSAAFRSIGRSVVHGFIGTSAPFGVPHPFNERGLTLLVHARLPVTAWERVWPLSLR